MALTGFLMAGLRMERGFWFLLGWSVALLIVVYQMWIARSRKADDCFRAFQLNNAYGAALTLGLMLDYRL